jgi:hypothetical protein
MSIQIIAATSFHQMVSSRLHQEARFGGTNAVFGLFCAFFLTINSDVSENNDI